MTLSAVPCRIFLSRMFSDPLQSNLAHGFMKKKRHIV
jgi:hypothetical protein